jgi:hypothetical protein
VIIIAANVELLIPFSKFLKSGKRIGADDIGEELINKNDGFDFGEDGGFRFLLVSNLYFHSAELAEKDISGLRNDLLIERNNYIKIDKIQFNRLRIVRRDFKCWIEMS